MPELTSKQREIQALSQQLSGEVFGRYADRWAAGQLPLVDFEGLFKQELKDLYILSVWTANGSTSGTQAQYGLAGRRLRDQYGFMHDFFQQIERGELTLAEIKARSNLYANSAGQILEQLGISEEDLPSLPAYPKDGSTQCRTNCNCGVRKDKVENGWDVYWDLNPGETCPDCRRRANNSPLQVRFGRIVNPGAWD